MAAVFKIAKVTELPSTIVANTMYLVSSGDSGLKIYVSNSDGSAVRLIEQPEVDYAKTIVFSDTAPDVSGGAPFWWDTDGGGLFVKYNDGTTTVWVEAVASMTIPDFAGTGEATTIARSDHWHTSLVIEADW